MRFLIGQDYLVGKYIRGKRREDIYRCSDVNAARAPEGDRYIRSVILVDSNDDVKIVLSCRRDTCNLDLENFFFKAIDRQTQPEYYL